MARLVSRDSVLLPASPAQVLCLTVTGRASSSDLCTLLALRRYARPPDGERAYLLRLDGCEWLGWDGGDDMVGLCPPDPMWRPVAVVVRPECMAWWRAYALTQARNGLVLGVFSCAVLAQQWLTQRALAIFPALEVRQIAAPEPRAHKRAAGALHR